MRRRSLGLVTLVVVVALIVATGVCLVHPDGAPDVCPSLLAATLGLTLALSLARSPEIVVARLAGYRPAWFDPLAPPPKV